MGTPPVDLLELQRQAVTFEGGLLVVLGPAGTGKTTVLAERFRWLVQRGLRPDRIAVLAASEGRADALREWLERGLAEGYDELVVTTPVQLAARILNLATQGLSPLEPTASASERFALLMERIDELPLERHDFAGSARALLTGFVRRVDRLKAHLIGAEDYARWAASLDAAAEPGQAALEREFSEVYRAHERILAQAGVRDAGDVLSDALRLIGQRPAAGQRFDHVLIDDAHELDLASAHLATAVAPQQITVAADPVLGGFSLPDAQVIELERSLRCPAPVVAAAAALTDVTVGAADHPGEVDFWRCAGERAQAQSVAADIERVLTRDGVDPAQVAVLVPSVAREG